MRRIVILLLLLTAIISKADEIEPSFGINYFINNSFVDSRTYSSSISPGIGISYYSKSNISYNLAFTERKLMQDKTEITSPQYTFSLKYEKPSDMSFTYGISSGIIDHKSEIQYFAGILLGFNMKLANDVFINHIISFEYVHGDPRIYIPYNLVFNFRF